MSDLHQTDLHLTGVDTDEFLPFARAVARHFHEDEEDDLLERYRAVVETDRALVVRDGDAIVANYAVRTTGLSVPRASPVPCAAVTAVGVAQTHRRRGLLRRMMTHGLDQAVARGEPVAALFASEATIYGRFGFGVSASAVRYRLDRAGAGFRDPVDPRLVRPATVEEALAAWPAVLETAVRSRRGGCIGRTDADWRFWLDNDPPAWRSGMSARRLVHVPGRGYAAYRVKDHYEDALPNGEVAVAELVAADTEAEQALWQHVTDIDLTARITAWARPGDDGLPWMLTDPLRLRAAEGPPLWTRLLDVPAALTARAYGEVADLVLEVHDPDRDQSGTWHLAVRTDGATCERTDRPPDLRLGVDALASLWLGGVRAAALLAGRRIEQLRGGAAAAADRVFATELLPWAPFEF